MYHYEYVSRNFRKGMKKQIISIFNQVQDLIRDEFTFRFDFIGSDSLNLVTCDFSQNIGFDFDVNIRINDFEERYEPGKIKHILMNAFNKILNKNSFFNYSKCEDSTRVFTIKVKDIENSRILHSCDIAIVNDCDRGQQYIHFNKKQNKYYWAFQPKGYDLTKKIELIKKYRHWYDVETIYLDKKNDNDNPYKKSRSLRAETINEVYKKYF